MKKLLVVVDYQKDFVNGSLGFEGADKLEEQIYNKVKEYLNNGDKVIFTYDTHDNNYLNTREGKNLPVVHCIDGSAGHELFGRLNEFENHKNTIHINKTSFGVAPQDMVKVAEQIGEVDEIELAGLVSYICVISNVCTFQAAFVNAQLYVNANLCAGIDEKLHKEVLDVMEGLQVKVIK